MDCPDNIQIFLSTKFLWFPIILNVIWKFSSSLLWFETCVRMLAMKQCELSGASLSCPLTAKSLDISLAQKSLAWWWSWWRHPWILDRQAGLSFGHWLQTFGWEENHLDQQHNQNQWSSLSAASKSESVHPIHCNVRTLTNCNVRNPTHCNIGKLLNGVGEWLGYRRINKI